MKKLLSILACLPLLASAQNAAVQKTNTNKTELGLNIGYSFDNSEMYTPMGFGGRPVRGAVSGFRNINKTQIGITVEGGLNSTDYWYMMPGAVVNQKFMVGQSYFYLGGMAGFAHAEETHYAGPEGGKNKQNGYVLGLQTGFAYSLGSHWAITSEVAVRSSQAHNKEYAPYTFSGDPRLLDIKNIPTSQRSSATYFPITFGVRYKF